MQTLISKVHIHLISDSSCETLISVIDAIRTEYAVTFEKHVYTMVRDIDKLTSVMSVVEQYNGVVVCTLSDDGLYKSLSEFCEHHHYPLIPILNPLISFFNSYLGQKAQKNIGGKHKLTEEYFNRIEALNYTMAHDDGYRLDNVDKADIVLIGVSRTSKTPTSIYLAHRGYKVANIPLVSEIALDLRNKNYGKAFLVGLVASPTRIMQIRENRLVHLQSRDYGQDYINLQKIIEEMKEARRFFDHMNMPVIDVTRYSVEETAANILNLKSEQENYL